MRQRALSWIMVFACICVTVQSGSEPTFADLYANSLDPQGTPTRSLALAAIESLHFNDVWAYNIDQGTWEELRPAGELPPVTRNHRAVYDPINQRMLCAGSMLGALWSLSLVKGKEEWSRAAPSSGYFPAGSTGVDMFYHAARKSVVYYGANALYLWNMETGEATQIALPYPPPSTSWPAAAIDEQRSRLLMYGGTGVSDDLWEIDLAPGQENGRFILPAGDAPPPRWLLRAAVDTVHDRFLMFGGNTYPDFQNGDYHDTTYELDLTSDTWHLIPAATPPSARGQYTTVWDPVTQRQYLFGGLYRIGPELENVVTFNEIWAYDVETKSWFELQPPPPLPRIRRMATAVLDSLNRRIIVFGGELIRPAGTTSPPVRAAIKVPRNGRQIGGNRVTIMAEIIDGFLCDAAEVRFQYRLPSLYGEWQDIVPAGTNHPNPDPTSPFFVHWDVTGFPPGDVDLRAVAIDRHGQLDTAPNDIVVTINHVNPDTLETETPDGHVQLAYAVDQSAVQDVAVADDSTSTYTHGAHANARLRFSQNTFSSGTLLIAQFQDLGQYPDLDPDGGAIGFLVDLSTIPPQTSLPPGKTIEITFQYPDENQDGVVDGMSLSEQSLTIRTRNGIGEIEELSSVAVDPVANTVSGETDHLSPFIVSGQPGSCVDGWLLFR